MRQYQKPWLLLKKNKQVKLKVLPHLVARVKKAIIKEKNMDHEFALLDTPEDDKYFLSSDYSRETNVLVLWLKLQVGDKI